MTHWSPLTIISTFIAGIALVTCFGILLCEQALATTPLGSVETTLVNFSAIVLAASFVVGLLSGLSRVPRKGLHITAGFAILISCYLILHATATEGHGLIQAFILMAFGTSLNMRSMTARRIKSEKPQQA